MELIWKEMWLSSDGNFYKIKNKDTFVVIFS